MNTKAGTTILVCQILFGGLSAQSQDFTFATNNGAITITGYTGPGGSVTIPDSVNGSPVVAIGDYVFNQHINVTALNIPNSITVTAQVDLAP